MDRGKSIEKVESLLSTIETTPLSQIAPKVLPIALECKDFEGYCVLSLLNTPVSDDSKTNEIQTKELIRILVLYGVKEEDIPDLLRESKEKFIQLKTLAKDKVSSHSIKELEEWFPEASKVLESITSSAVTSVTRARYQEFAERIPQMRRMYEVIRGYITTKLTYYQQVLKMVMKAEVTIDKMLMSTKKRVFVVHGHNGEIKQAVARLLEKQGIQPIILHEQANQGSTIIEKIERNSEVGCAICLFTADDTGGTKGGSLQVRARQNVVFESGYFIGRLGRENVIILADQDIEMPSDLQGVVYTSVHNWQISVLNDLRAMGFDVDYNKLSE